MTTLEEIDPLYHFSTHYPDRLSLLDATYSTNCPAFDKKSPKSRISRRKNNPRYKTQPITFDEIKEVEEPVTPNDENINNVNSFLTKLEQNGGISTENHLQSHKRYDSVRCDLIATEVGSGVNRNNIWYDSPYPTKLSFLDIPETYHHHTTKEPPAATEKSKFKSRAARRRNNPRYKTQPITFDEIKEVEEPENGEQENSETTVSRANTSPSNVKLSSNKATTNPQKNLVSCGYNR